MARLAICIIYQLANVPLLQLFFLLFVSQSHSQRADGTGGKSIYGGKCLFCDAQNP